MIVRQYDEHLLVFKFNDTTIPTTTTKTAIKEFTITTKAQERLNKIYISKKKKIINKYVFINNSEIK